MAKRRTSTQMRADLRKVRKRFYNQKYYYRDRLKTYESQFEKAKTPKEKRAISKKIANAEKKLVNARKKINKSNIRLVKYTKKWKNVKRNTRKIKQEINQLKEDIASGKFNEKEKNKKFQRIRDLSKFILLLEGKQFEPYVGEVILSKGKTDFIVSDDGDYAEEYIVVWELKEKVTNAIGTGRFDTIDIDGELMSTQDLGAVIMELDMYITEIAEKQFKTSTPMVRLAYDFPNRNLEVSNLTAPK